MSSLSRVKGTVGKSLKAPSSRILEKEEGLDFGPTVVFHEKTKTIGTPFLFHENDWLTLGDGDGYQEWFSRQGKTKNAIKWGQLKLFTSEMQFFNKFWNPKEVPNPVCVYVGAAPGTHIPFLAQMFPWFTFHLYDPRDVFDPELKKNDKIQLHTQFFSDEDAKKYAKRNDIFFLSDIRSTTYNKGNFPTEQDQKENEELVRQDMERQMRWLEIIRPYKAQIKFRLPYTYHWQKDTTFEYFDGDIYRQVWAPQTSTETRLVPDLQAPKRKWNSKLYEQMMFYHNNIVREHAVFINPLTGVNGPIDADLGLTQDFDSVVFVSTLQDYCKKFHKGLLASEEETVKILARAIIDNVGKKIITISNLRAGVKGRLSPGTEEEMKKLLMVTEDDE